MFPEAVIWPDETKFEALTYPATLILPLAEIEAKLKEPIINILLQYTSKLVLILPEAVMWPDETKFEALTYPAALISALAEIEPTVKWFPIVITLVIKFEALTYPAALIFALAEIEPTVKLSPIVASSTM